MAVWRMSKMVVGGGGGKVDPSWSERGGKTSVWRGGGEETAVKIEVR